MSAHNHPENRRYKVTILRVDGTAWPVPYEVKHVLFKRTPVLELYVGEHGQADRKLILIPYERIDHVYVEEINN